MFWPVSIKIRFKLKREQNIENILHLGHKKILGPLTPGSASVYIYILTAVAAPGFDIRGGFVNWGGLKKC